MNAQHKLRVLGQEWRGCTKCGLHSTRLRDDIFFGYGAAHTPKKYLVIGGAPTESDEVLHTLFSGDEGIVLTRLLTEAKISPDECFFTYAVGCRPKVFIPATDTEQERIDTRAPDKAELAACRPRLYEQLYLVDPRIIIAVGETATKAVVRGRLPRFVEAVGKQYTCALPAATREDREDGRTQGKARYQNLFYPVLAVPDMKTILSNPSTANHGPYNIALRTLTRAQLYANFIATNERVTTGAQ